MNKSQKEILQSQLNSEEKTIKELKQVYQQALKDCDEKIRQLSARADMNPDNLQSIIYQKQYQQALKGQLEGVLENMHSESYATISDYLTRCYQDGYIGVMYDLQGQGIPLIMPIDQEAVTKAIQIDSKLSKSLYDRLGEDTNYLKKAVRAEVSRGIANGSTWNDMAAKLSKHMENTPFNKAYNNSIRIARTEGHRVQAQSALDAQRKAKAKGADIVKQWDASLDGRTRTTHRQLDGQIREIDEPFEVAGMKADAPGMFGNPAEDCNCRCALLQRAKWALDESELETLKQRSEYFGLDKSEDFEDFKKKYLNISEEDIKGANSGSVRSNAQKIKINYAKANDVFIFGENIPDDANITPSSVLKHLETSEIGKETLEYIISSGIKPQLIYEQQRFSYRGEQHGNVIKIYMANIANDRVAAQTVIHEITHLKYDIGGCQWAEAVCMANEKMHKESRNYLTNEEKRYIVELAKRAYPELKWKKGGYKDGKYF